MKKTIEEIYGEEKAKQLRLKLSISKLGNKNPMFGKPISDKTREKLSKRKQELIKTGWSPCKGKKRPDVKERMINNNPMKNKLIAKKSSEIWKKMFNEGKIKINTLKGENHPNWKGELALKVTRKDYSSEFNDNLRKQVKERDGYICQECMNKDLILCVHHIDYNKKNNSRYNLITLCLKCHGKIKKDKEHWKNYYKMKMFIKELFNPQKIIVFNENKLCVIS